MIKKFTTYLTAIKGYAPNTALGYEKDLTAFALWIRDHKTGKRWSTITRDDIDDYIIDCEARGLKPATTNRHLAAISGIYRYFIRQGLLKENPCKYESRRKVAKTLPNTIPTDDLKRAYESAYGATKVMIGLLATTGIRIQELLDIAWEDIDFQHHTIRINGKGAKERIVYTTPEALATLQECQAIQENTGRVFTCTQREARTMIWEHLRHYSKAPQLSPHAIRHTYATNLASKGINVTTIAGILGHNQIATTQKYIDMTQTDYATISRQNNFI